MRKRLDHVRKKSTSSTKACLKSCQSWEAKRDYFDQTSPKLFPKIHTSHFLFPLLIPCQKANKKEIKKKKREGKQWDNRTTPIILSLLKEERKETKKGGRRPLSHTLFSRTRNKLKTREEEGRKSSQKPPKKQKWRKGFHKR